MNLDLDVGIAISESANQLEWYVHGSEKKPIEIQQLSKIKVIQLYW